MPAVKKIRLLATLLLAAAAGVLVLVLRDTGGAPTELSPEPAVAAGARVPGSETALLAPAGEGARAPAAAPPGAALAPEAAESPAGSVAAEVAGESEGPFLIGCVVDANGVPVPGAQVRIEAAGSGGGLLMAAGRSGGGKPLSETAVTDGAGNYRVPRGGHADAEVTIDVQARGFVGRTEVRFPDAGRGQAGLGTTVLELGVVLAGSVTDAAGAPVAGASVLRTTREEEGLLDGILGLAASMNGGGVERVETDGQGRFELAHEPAGEYVLVFEHEEHPRGRLEGATPAAGRSDLTLELRFAPAARLSGRILDFPAGREHVIVQAELEAPTEQQEATVAVTFFDEISGGSGPTARVAEDGSFEFEGLVAGAAYRLRAFVKSGMFERIPASDARTARAGDGALELHWDSGSRLVFDVVDADTGRALEGAVEVRHLWQERGSSPIPSSVKKHVFEGSPVALEELRPDPSPGLLDLLVSSEGYLDHRERGVVVEAEGSAELAAVRLRRAPTLRVRVLDGASGRPVKRARVALHPEDTAAPAISERDEDVPYEHLLENRSSSAKTDADGWCELAVCGAPSARLEVTRSGFVDHVEAGYGVPAEGGREETIQLWPGGEVEVTVVDGQDRPVDAARVFRRTDAGEDGESRETNSKGVALFKDLPAGEHEFRAVRGGGAGNVRIEVNDDDDDPDESTSDWESVAVASGDRSRLRLGVPSNASVHGRVSAGGVPVPGVPVIFLPGSEASEADAIMTRVTDGFAAMMPGASSRTRTDDEGRYRMADVQVGEHRLHVAPSPGAPSHVVAAELLEGDNRVDIELPGGAVEGRVLDAAGKPIAGARVRIGQANAEEVSGQMEVALSLFGADPGGVRTDYDGSFAISGLPGGVPLNAGVEAQGFVPGASQEFTVPEGGRKRGVDVTLQRGGSVLVNVAESGPFVMLTARFLGEADPPALTRHAFARRGKAIIDGLNPGPWSISASGDDSDEAAVDDPGQLVDVRAGEQVEVTLQP